MTLTTRKLGRALLTAASLLVLTALASPAFAQDDKVYVLNIGTVAPDNSPWGQQLKAVAKRIKQESNGRINVKLFFGTAGGEKSIVRQVKSGQLQGAGVSTGALATLVPELNVFELPYLFDTPEQADAVIDGPLFKPVDELLSAYGFKLYIFSENGFRHFAADRCISTPKDLGGLQMRAQESWVHEETYRALGGSPVRISIPEVLESLRTGNVKGFDNTPLFAFAAGWHQQVTHWTISDHIYQPAVVVYSQQWFDTLPADLQQILLANREGETKKGRESVRKITPKLLENLKAFKITVCSQTPAQRAEFSAKAKSVHKTFRAKGGKKGVELLDLIEKNKK